MDGGVVGAAGIVVAVVSGVVVVASDGEEDVTLVVVDGVYCTVTSAELLVGVLL